MGLCANLIEKASRIGSPGYGGKLNKINFIWKATTVIVYIDILSEWGVGFANVNRKKIAALGGQKHKYDYRVIIIQLECEERTYRKRDSVRKIFATARERIGGQSSRARFMDGVGLAVQISPSPGTQIQ